MLWQQHAVQVWEEAVTIPTYPAASPEKSPLFLENRAYQGSSGKVYPLPVTEKISDNKEDVTYQAIFLENEYLKVMVLRRLEAGSSGHMIRPTAMILSITTM